MIESNPNKISYRIDEAVKASGLGRTLIYELIASGALQSFKVCGRRLILKTDLIRFLTLARDHNPVTTPITKLTKSRTSQHIRSGQQ